MGSKDNVKHVAGGGDIKVNQTAKTKLPTQSTKPKLFTKNYDEACENYYILITTTSLTVFLYTYYISIVYILYYHIQ